LTMKAVILAGGLGTRLRPLTYSIPKSLVPLAGKPLIRRIIDGLPSSVDTVVLAVSYMKEALEDYFRVEPCGRKVILVNESTPMGTGGALKNVAQHIDGTFIVQNGDCVSSLDIKAMVRAHRESGGLGTLALWEVEDPSAFGVVDLERDMRITDFQEKPSLAEAKSNLINAGVYVFEPEILDYIGKGQVSIEREVFPRVIEYGLYGHRFQGFWVDCGTLKNTLVAQRAMLDKENPPVLADFDCAIIPPNLIRAKEMKGCHVGPNVCLESEVRIGAGTHLENALIMKGACLGTNCKISGSIIGPGIKVNDNESIVDSIVAAR
jgi:mannose-1-phosphate guanylyltransferase